ncbi:NRAMP (natural resistance-associated macrophage protein) metal ion transporters [Halorientalis persicus]|jgi:manganese transport protein|uniref:NRAMP (Natural resistance-associated macrophage protein) metal ion transporters n=1 Tax=Halorientalis persicus TaxID=1367881 RepID=A0A1H8HB38_9EURY|nr:Nramp family divalent metal transporter [Halorientalis persicus]SEN52788.1 NRAMP (natural resistance-associated macrophage protein) metal ion transporters [Halorientalis persicus]
MNVIQRLKAIGPGAMVAAAFIGPGTVTAASVTGARLGYALLWTIAFSIVATIVLQEMSARLGLVSGEGLGEALRNRFDNQIVESVAIFLVVGAIGVGTAAYESGNILGGAAGLATITGVSSTIWGVVMGLVAGALLFTGKYKLIERALVGLVAVMALSFVASAILIGPDLGAIAGGFVPSIPEGSLYLITGLIGTTVVGYNLFLHASNVQERWSGPGDLAESRTDTILSIAVGGFITITIMVTAAAAFPLGTELDDVGQMAQQLEPLAGSYAKIFFSIGLFAAGFTSATTAPLAGAWATTGALGWDSDLKSPKFRAVWGTILAVGVGSVLLGGSPVEIIVFAQVVNGILLPIVAIFLIYAMNQSDLLGEYTNGPIANALGAIVTLIVVGLGLRTLLNVAGVL